MPLFQLSTQFRDSLIYAYGSGTRQNLSFADIKRLSIPIPPKPEQERIVQYIDTFLWENDLIIAKTKREITLVEEYRCRLIADVVTGKLDVREAAYSLPDELYELEIAADKMLLDDPSEGDFEDAQVVEEE